VKTKEQGTARGGFDGLFDWLLDRFAFGQTLTAPQFAQALYGERYTFDQVLEVEQALKELQQRGILVPGPDGCGVRLAFPARKGRAQL
jgi:hypothetical protein